MFHDTCPHFMDAAIPTEPFFLIMNTYCTCIMQLAQYSTCSNEFCRAYNCISKTTCGVLLLFTLCNMEWKDYKQAPLVEFSQVTEEEVYTISTVIGVYIQQSQSLATNCLATRLHTSGLQQGEQEKRMWLINYTGRWSCDPPWIMPINTAFVITI